MLKPCTTWLARVFWGIEVFDFVILVGNYATEGLATMLEWFMIFEAWNFGAKFVSF